MSTEAAPQGSAPEQSPIDLFFGAVIQLRHKRTGVYLASIQQRYKHSETSGQYMVVGFPAADPGELTRWRIKPAHGMQVTDQVLQAKLGDKTTLRLEHIASGRNLHSHDDRKSPVSQQQEVTAFGNQGFGDTNDNWLLECDPAASLTVQSIRLIHVNSKGALHSHETEKEKREMIAGYQEVTAFSSRDENDFWNIEVLQPIGPLTQQPLVTLSVPERWGPRSFYDIDSLESWCTNERNRWSWLHQLEHNAIPVAKPNRNAFGELNARLSEVRAKLDLPDFPAAVEGFKATFDQTFSQYGFLIEDEPRSVFVNQLASENNLVAGAAYNYFLRKQFPIVIRNLPAAVEVTMGISHGVCYESNRGATFDELKEAYQTALQEMRERSDGAQQLAQEAKGAIAENERVARREREQRQQAFDNLLTQSNEKLEAIRQAFSKEMALQAPVHYWARKRTWHIWIAVAWAIAALAAAGISWIFLTSTWTFLFEHTQSEKNIEWWRVGTFIIFATFALWIVRILVQMFLSNVHLATDAAERVTMIKAYLALLKEPNAVVAPEEKQVILAVIFRPASSGVVKDDGGPSTVIEKLFNRIDPSAK